MTQFTATQNPLLLSWSIMSLQHQNFQLIHETHTHIHTHTYSHIMFAVQAGQEEASSSPCPRGLMRERPISSMKPHTHARTHTCAHTHTHTRACTHTDTHTPKLRFQRLPA